MNNIKKTFVYDLETLPGIFTATFIDKDSDEERVFVITKEKDERKHLFKFLKEEVLALIGYNCIHFDAQILEYMFRRPECTVEEIRRYAEIITSDNERRPDVPEWKLKIQHLDLFRALSLSTKAKRTGLKWTEFMLDMENIEDMPSQGEGSNWEEMVLSYNKNDVLATKHLFNAFYSEIELRKIITKDTGVNVMNSTEPDMVKKLFGKYLSEAMGISVRDLRSMHTVRNSVDINGIILPYIAFRNDAFNAVLSSFRSLTIFENGKLEDNTKFGQTLVWQGIEIDFGLGGIHAARPNTVIRSDDKYVIKTCDVISMYPNLMIKNRWCPAHLPKDIFLNLYEGFLKTRLSIPKSNPWNYFYKIMLNSTYGLTNDDYSFLRDRLVTLQICINGQLSILMLIEMLSEIPEMKLIMANTDGIEVYIPREYEEMYYRICKEWEELTKLSLEYDDYKSMIISDVNNYISINTKDKAKCKGKYEYQNIPLHKNKSYGIIAKAVHDYWVNGTFIEETIKNHDNIFDFCAGVKASWSEKKGKSSYELFKVENREIKVQKLSKTVRYFISNKGGTLIKKYQDGSFEQVEAPVANGKKIHKEWKVTYFNKSYQLDMKDYDIDYSYYIHNARKWINDIEQIGQLKLL